MLSQTRTNTIRSLACVPLITAAVMSQPASAAFVNPTVVPGSNTHLWRGTVTLTDASADSVDFVIGKWEVSASLANNIVDGRLSVSAKHKDNPHWGELDPGPDLFASVDAGSTMIDGALRFTQGVYRDDDEEMHFDHPDRLVIQLDAREAFTGNSTLYFKLTHPEHDEPVIPAPGPLMLLGAGASLVCCRRCRPRMSR